MSASAHVEVDLVGVWLCLAFKSLKRNHKFIDRVKGKRDKMAWGRETIKGNTWGGQTCSILLSD